MTGCSRMAAMIFNSPPPVRAVLKVEIKNALEQLGPTQPHRVVVRKARLALGGLRWLGGRHRLLWNTCARSFALGASTPWKRIRWQARPRHQSCKPPHELQPATSASALVPPLPSVRLPPGVLLRVSTMEKYVVDKRND